MRKHIGVILAFLILMLSIPMSVCASPEKTVEVNIPRDYISATFIVKFETSRSDCLTTVVSPDGMEYIAEYSNSNTMKCIVNNVKEGKWLIKISSVAGEEIGIVDITVEGSKEQIAKEADDIKVASNITGLILYMKDDNLEVEWNDNSCGAVKITVADGLSLQVLDDVTVSIKEPCYYSFEVPKDIEQLLVTVVPTTSANLAGAAKSFTLDTYNYPDAEVTFVSDKQTNQSSINANVNLNGTYKIVCCANDKIVSESEYLENGEYSFPLPVVAGNNDYKVYVVDQNHYMRSTSFSCTGDFIAPQLNVDGASRSENVSVDNFHISGSVFDFNLLSINGNAVNVFNDGIFEYDYLLHEGENIINIVASDEAGNISDCDITVIYEIPDYSSYYIAGGCILLFVILCVIVVFISKKVKNIRKVKKSIVKEDKCIKEHKKCSLDIFKSNYNIDKFIGSAVIVVVLFILLRFMLAVVVIQSESMEPALKTGDVAIFNRLSYVANDVQIGDIVCIWSDEDNKYIGKRIIGLPGDYIIFRDGSVIVNGNVLDESLYIDSDIETNCTLEFTVPEDCYFVLGDNREISRDSRYFDNPYISKDDIIGKYMGFSGINVNF